MPPIPPLPGIGGVGTCFLRQLGNHRFRRDEQASNRGCILQRRADHLGRIDNSLGHQVAELVRLRVVTVRVSFRLPTKSILYQAWQPGKYASHVSRLSLLVENLILPKA